MNHYSMLSKYDQFTRQFKIKLELIYLFIYLFIYFFFIHYFRRKEWCPKKIVLITCYKVSFVGRHKLALFKAFTSRMHLKILVCLK